MPLSDTVSQEYPYQVADYTTTIYGSQKYRLNVYYPISDETFPLVIVSPGISGDADVYDTVSRFIAGYGYVVGAFSSQAKTMNEIQVFINGSMDGINRTIAYFASDACPLSNVDLNQIGLVGHSAGGTAVLMFGSLDSRIDTIVSLAPWYDSSLGIAEVSCASFEVLTGSEDDTCPPTMGEEWYNVLSAPIKNYEEIEGADHNVGIAAGNSDLTDPANVAALDYPTTWLARHLKPNTQPTVAPEPTPKETPLPKSNEPSLYPIVAILGIVLLITVIVAVAIKLRLQNLSKGQ